MQPGANLNLIEVSTTESGRRSHFPSGEWHDRAFQRGGAAVSCHRQSQSIIEPRADAWLRSIE